jgi:Amt family ammonium transporter
MQSGFALVSSGLCRARNAAHVVAVNFIVFSLAVMAFWMFGFAFMFGGLGRGWQTAAASSVVTTGIRSLNQEWSLNLFGHSFGILGHAGFFLGPPHFDAAVFSLFVFQAAIVAIVAVVPAGAMAERWRVPSAVFYAIWVGALPYAIFGNWVWGGGWLAQLGQGFGLGHGLVDFAGSTVVHLCAGLVGLAGALALGPRIGKFGREGKPRPMPGHNLGYVVVGTLILAFGWFALNTGPLLGAGDERVALAAMNTLLSSAAGTAAAYITMMSKFGKPDPSILCNGTLGGLVAISASCPFVTPFGAVIVGGVAGFLVVHAVLFLEGRMRVDDPVGAVSVHGVSGAWGALSLGLLADGSFGAGMNGVHTLVNAKTGALQTLLATSPDALAEHSRLIASGWSDVGVSGAFGKLFGSPINDWSQLTAQLIGVVTCVVFVGALSMAWFKISNLAIRLRSRREDEIAGLDLPELGAECYPDYHLTDTGTSRFD